MSDELVRLLAEHLADDRQRFAEVQASLYRIEGNVESLLYSRSFVRGAWRAVVIVTTGVSALVTLLVTWLRG